MIKKIILICFLSISFILILYFKPWRKEILPVTRTIDRIPYSAYVGSLDLLKFSKEIVETNSFNKLKFRQLFSSDFLLSQSRSLGVNIQNPLYFFLDEELNGGILIEVTDYNKLNSGIFKLLEPLNFEYKRSKNRILFKNKIENIFISYDQKVVLLYFGKNYNEIERKVFSAQYKESTPQINKLLSINNENSFITIYSEGKHLEKYSIENLIMKSHVDSMNLIVATKLEKENSFGIRMKEGFSYKNLKAKNSIDLHLNFQEFKKQKTDKLYLMLESISNKYGIPFIDFLDAWDGDISYRERGKIKVEEKFYETVLDEDFNTVLEEKIKTNYIPDLTALLSVNQNYNQFMNLLKRKGIVVKEYDNEKIRFLFSPPLISKKNKNLTFFYSGNHDENIVLNNSNFFYWQYQDIPFKVELDSIWEKSAFGRISIAIEDLLDSDFLLNQNSSQ